MEYATGHDSTDTVWQAVSMESREQGMPRVRKAVSMESREHCQSWAMSTAIPCFQSWFLPRLHMILEASQRTVEILSTKPSILSTILIKNATIPRSIPSLTIQMIQTTTNIKSCIFIQLLRLSNGLNTTRSFCTTLSETWAS
jgi:hypothetical protein